MGKIICLMGKSSTGKDTIYKHLLADRRLGLKKIVPYTTRPIRNGERDGVEYFFRSEQDFRKKTGLLRTGNIVPFTGCGDILWRTTGRSKRTAIIL